MKYFGSELLLCEKFKYLDFWSQLQKWNIKVMPTTTILPAEHNKMETLNFFFHFSFPFFSLLILKKVRTEKEKMKEMKNYCFGVGNEGN